MTKKNMKSIIWGAIFVIGLIILMYSINLGDNEMSKIMGLHGGGMDTNTYLIYLEQSITKYRFIGIILSAIGGLGVLINTRVTQQ